MSDLELLKKLREETGVGFSACKKALEETNNNYNDAVDLLRKQGQAKAISKSDRVTSEGLCGIFKNEVGVSCVKVNCETDFVARNEKFQKLVSFIAEIALKTKSNSVENLLNQNVENKSIKEIITENIASIGENIVLSDVNKTIVLDIDNGKLVSSYSAASNADVTVTANKDVVGKIITGKTTFQGAFMSGLVTAKGRLDLMRMFDRVFTF